MNDFFKITNVARHTLFKCFPKCWEKDIITITSQENWDTLTLDRSKWRNTIIKGGEHFESTRQEHQMQKMGKRKERQAARVNNLVPTIPPGNTCSHCGKISGLQIGLISHLRTHGKTF